MRILIDRLRRAGIELLKAGRWGCGEGDLEHTAQPTLKYCPELKSHGVASRQGLEGLMGRKTEDVPAYSKLPGRLLWGKQDSLYSTDMRADAGTATVRYHEALVSASCEGDGKRVPVVGRWE